MLIMLTHMIVCILMCILIHIVDVRATLQNFVMIGLNLNFANKFVWVRKGANPLRPKKIWVQKFTPILFDVGVSSHMT